MRDRKQVESIRKPRSRKTATPEPRFDLGRDSDAAPLTRASLRELLEELNGDNALSNGELFSYDSLDRVQTFISLVAGRKPATLDEPVPTGHLKAIKLLLRTSRREKKQLFTLIDPLGSSARATMEQCSITTTPRDPEGARIISKLARALANEIDPVKLRLLDDMASAGDQLTFAEGLNRRIEHVNDATLVLFKRGLSSEDQLIEVYDKISINIRSLSVATPKSEPAVAEAIYCHLKTLGLQHFIAEHRDRFESNSHIHGVLPCDELIASFCKYLTKKAGWLICPDTKIVSVRECQLFMESLQLRLNKLVTGATGWKTVKTRHMKNIGLSQFILRAHAYRSYDETDPDAKCISVVDMVAALCAFAYGQKSRADKELEPPYWPGQESQGKDPEQLLRKGLRDDRPYQYQAAFQFYYYKFSEYRAALTHTTGSYRAWMRFQMARLDVYEKLLKLNDISAIVKGSRQFDELCLHGARNTLDQLSRRAM
ncbi:TPA: hypothetical protein R4K21_003441 [Stenotrophomonas maltophilia]|nr:hypothetical protein [Stenotrophomonas maltophilia]